MKDLLIRGNTESQLSYETINTIVLLNIICNLRDTPILNGDKEKKIKNSKMTVVCVFVIVTMKVLTCLKVASLLDHAKHCLRIMRIVQKHLSFLWTESVK